MIYITITLNNSAEPVDLALPSTVPTEILARIVATMLQEPLAGRVRFGLRSELSGAVLRTDETLEEAEIAHGHRMRLIQLQTLPHAAAASMPAASETLAAAQPNPVAQPNPSPERALPIGCHAWLQTKNGQIFPCVATELVVGRNPSKRNLVNFLDLSELPGSDTISREHLQLLYRPPYHALQLLPDVKNPPILNGDLLQARERRRLKSGDVLRIGDIVLFFYKNTN